MPRPHPRIAAPARRAWSGSSARARRAPRSCGILQALGFAVDDSGADLQVVVPSFRRDIAQEDDLVEEIIRIWGYDKIPLTLAGGGELLPVTRPRGLRRVARA